MAPKAGARKATRETVFAACDKLEAEESSWGYVKVINEIGGGSPNTVAPLVSLYKKLRKLHPNSALSSINVAKLVEVAETAIVEQLEPAKSSYTAKEQALDSTLEELSTALPMIEAKLESALETVVDRNNRIEDLAGELEQKNLQLSSAWEHAQELEKQLLGANEKITDLHRQSYEDREQALFQQRQEAMSELSQTISQLQSQHNETIRAIRAEHKVEMNDTALEHSQAMGKKDQAIEELRRRHEQAERELNAERERVKDSLQEQLAESASNLDGERRRAASLEHKCDELEQRLRSNESRLEQEHERHEKERRRLELDYEQRLKTFLDSTVNHKPEKRS